MGKSYYGWALTFATYNDSHHFRRSCENDKAEVESTLMNQTRIVHYESWSDPSRRSDIEHFVAMYPNGDVDDYENVHVYIVFPLRLLDSLGMRETKDVSFVMRMALDHIRRQIAAGAFTPGQNYEYVFTSESLDLSKFKWKECAYQASEATGLRCTAAHLRDRAGGVTTAAICQACELPSTDILCDELVYPVITSNEEASQMTARHFVDSKCNVGSAEFKGGSGCVPQGYSCWRKTIAVAEAGVSDPPGSLLSRIDHINTLFHGKFGTSLFKLQKVETILTLRESTRGKDAFKSKLQALGRLIEHMAGYDLAIGVGATPTDKASINGLSAFLTKVGVADVMKIIQPIRDIMTVRVDWSHDVTRQDVVSACARLGIPLPIVDYDNAWGQTVMALQGALGDLETSLP